MKVLRSALLILFALSLGCCSSPSPENPNGSRHDSLRISLTDEIRPLNPSMGVNFPTAFITRMLFEGLMIVGLDGKVKPAIADSYSLSSDQKTYTFHLRPSKWSNGDPLTAYDFEYSWKKVLNPKTGAIGVHHFYEIRNAQKAALGEVPIEAVGVHALDNSTLVVDLEHPVPYFLDLIASPYYFPVNQRVDSHHPSWHEEIAEGFVCNGPYLLSCHSNQFLMVKKNPAYWDAPSVKMSEISIEILTDESEQLHQFLSKKLDWIGKPLSKISLDAIAKLRMNQKIQYEKTLGLYWYFVNTEAFPFNNKKLRQAFSYAIDRSMLARYILQGNEEPAFGILPYHLSTQSLPFFKDNDKSLALHLFNEGLKELGISKENLPEITLNYSSTPAHLRISSALQQQWSETFGIPIKLESLEWRAHYGKLMGGNYQLGGMFWQSWLRDPIYILDTFRSKGNGINLSHWENPDYQHLLTAAEHELDPTKRLELFHQAETLLLDELPAIPLYFSSIAYAKNEKLHDVFISDLYEIDFRWSYFEE